MLAAIAAAIVGAAAAAFFERARFPKRVPVRTLGFVAVGAMLGFGLGAAIRTSGDSSPSLTIYSSLPHRNSHGAPDKRIKDMENAIRLALSDHGGKAGKFTVKYRALDETDRTGTFLPLKIQANAKTAVRDGAVYIGDFSSSASIESIRILSKAGVPQISPSSTRVGFTIGDALSDTGEPGQYYRGGSRNFVRVIPTDEVQAAALNARMLKDHCTKVGIIYDGLDYSQGLSVLMSLFARPLRIFSEDVRPNERPQRYERLARRAKRRRVDCFLYMGADNSNTFGIFKTFASALPGARLFGTDGVSETSLTDTDGSLAGFADRVRLMVPPRDLPQYAGFRRSFGRAYNGASPDPYAVYGYEAMNLALDAIRESGTGTRVDILDQLTSTGERASLLGTYSIDSSGDTTLVDWDYLTFKGGEPKLRRTVRREVLKRTLDYIRDRT